MSSIKIDEVVRSLPEHRYNVAEAMRAKGYAPSTTRSGQQYARIRKAIEKHYNPEQIKADIRKAEQDFMKAGDNSNRARMLELRAKVCGLGRDITTNQVNIINDDTIKTMATRVNVNDNTKGS